MPGILYIVATPIGNLEDLTYRAARILGEVDRIACEDTRQARKLLEHYRIYRPTVSYHEHNEAARSAELVGNLLEGESVALVSDAGVPLISDPGYRIVRAAIAAGVKVVPVPGASAALAALSASGLPTDSFRFAGFLPPRSAQRKKALAEIAQAVETIIFYETPHRILDALADIEEILGDRPLVLARELTKVHEEFLRGTAAGIRALLASRPAVKGEITLLLGKAVTAVPRKESIADAVAAYRQHGLSRMDAIKAVARDRGLSKRDVYREVEALSGTT